MEENDKQEPQPPIAGQVKEYLETYIELTKLKAIDRGTSVFASMVTDVSIILVLSLAFLFGSITLAFFLGEVFHSDWKGFGSVALIYIVIIVFLMLFRKNLERPLINALIKKFFK
jgi:hypothetical protein